MTKRPALVDGMIGGLLFGSLLMFLATFVGRGQPEAPIETAPPPDSLESALLNDGFDGRLFSHYTDHPLDDGWPHVVLVFDVECGFCAASLSSWRHLLQSATGAAHVVAITPSELAEAQDFLANRSSELVLRRLTPEAISAVFGRALVPLTLILAPNASPQWARVGPVADNEPSAALARWSTNN